MGCEPPKPEMSLIPSGPFKLGLDEGESLPEFMSDTTSSRNARPAQEMNLESFYIDFHEVTYGEFLQFKPTATYNEGRLNHPVRGVSWYEADAYCQWRGKRLPTEEEWEKAARGTDGRLFVWGNEFNREWANFGKTVQPPATFAKDTSVSGVFDMNGNVSEWTSSWYLPYPNAKYEDLNYGKKFKVIRGGAFQRRKHGFLEQFVTLPYRSFAPRELRSWDTGFRCAKSP